MCLSLGSFCNFRYKPVDEPARPVINSRGLALRQVILQNRQFRALHRESQPNRTERKRCSLCCLCLFSRNYNLPQFGCCPVLEPSNPGRQIDCNVVSTNSPDAGNAHEIFVPALCRSVSQGAGEAEGRYSVAASPPDDRSADPAAGPEAGCPALVFNGPDSPVNDLSCPWSRPEFSGVRSICC